MLTNEQKNIPIKLQDGLTLNFCNGEYKHRGTMMQTGFEIWMLMCEPQREDIDWNCYAYNRWSDKVFNSNCGIATIADLETAYRITVNSYSLAKQIGSKG